MADEADRMKITEGELHVCGNRIAYVAAVSAAPVPVKRQAGTGRSMHAGIC